MKAWIIVLFLSCLCNAQNELWKHFYSHCYVTSIAAKGDYVWIGYDCGLERRSIKTNQIDQYFTYNSGLIESNIVRSVAVDSSGSLWVSTGTIPNNFEFANGYFDGGITKFDGIKWNSYSSHFINYYHTYDISFIAADRHHNIWVMSSGRFYRYDMLSDSAYVVSGSYGDTTHPWGRVVSAAFDSPGNSWFASDEAGLYKFNGKDWKRISGFEPAFLTSIALDKKGTLWIGTSTSGIAKYDSTGLNYFNRYNSGLPDDHISAVTVDSMDNVWIGTWNKGLAKFSGSDWKLYNTSTSVLPSDIITCITIDSKGSIWAGTDNGYARFDGSVWTAYNTSNSKLKTNYISKIAADSSDNIWIITDHELFRFSNGEAAELSKSNLGIQDDYFSDVAVDTKGNKWFLGSSVPVIPGYKYPTFAVRYNDSSWVKFDSTNTNPLITKFHSICFDSIGNTWFALDSGLAKYDGSSWTVYLARDNIPPFYVPATLSMAAKADGNIYLGSEYGIIRFDGNKWFGFYRPYNGRGGINDMLVDHKGLLWAAKGMFEGGSRAFGGLTRFNWYKQKGYRSCLWVWTVDMDKEYNIWAGSRWCGLDLVDVKGDSVYSFFNTSNSGLPDNNVLDIAIDRYNRKWIATANAGIALFSFDEKIPNGINKDVYKAHPEFSLSQNYPNPFNPVTTISYSLARGSVISLKVYDILGREIAILEGGYKAAGNHKVKFDASLLPSGVYIYRIQAGEYRETKKCLVLK